MYTHRSKCRLKYTNLHKTFELVGVSRWLFGG